MKEDFIPYDEALALKELGYDEPCLRQGNPNGHTMWRFICSDDSVSVEDILMKPLYESMIGIPTYSQSFRFFEKQFSLFTEILLDRTTEPKWCFKIYEYEDFGNYEEVQNIDFSLYKTKLEAKLACLRKLIEIVKNEK